MILTIHSNPVPAPRMSQRDKWKKRPAVMKYWAWRDRIRWTWMELPFKERKRFYKPVVIGFNFYIVGYPAIDLDNLIKGVKDGLVRAGVIQGDTIRHVPKYDNPEAFFLCDDCPYHKSKFPPPAKACPGIKKCEEGFAEVTIRERS